MADTAVAITAGTGTNIDTRTEATNGNHRQVVVIGDPATNAGVAPVDATAGLKVDLGADNDVTVTGTVDLGATDNAVLDAIAASVAAIDTDATTIIGHVDGLETLIGTTNTTLTTIDGRVDGIEALLGTIDADTSNLSTKIDTIAGDTTAIETAVQLIDDVIYVDDADWTDSTSKHALVGGLYQSTPQTITDGDVAPFNMTATGALHVADAGGSLTVDGTVTAELSATDNAVLDNIDADLTTIIGHVDGLETLIGTTNSSLTTIDGRVDGIEALLTTIDADTSNLSVVGGGTEAAALRVTIANNSTGVLSIDDNGSTVSIDDGGGVITVDGTVAVTNSDITSVKTATELLDDTVFVDDADWTADTSKHLLVGGVTQVATTANTDGDVTPLTTNAFRELRTAIPESDLATAGTSHVKKYYTNAGAVTDGIVWSPAAGKRWYVTDLIINVSAAATVTLEDDKAGGDEAVMKFELAANSGVSHTFNTPWFSGEDAADLLVTTSAGNIYITVTGYEV